MRTDKINIFRLHLAPLKSVLHALRLPLAVRQNVIGSVGIDAISENFAVNFCSARQSILQPFENVKTASFADDNPVAIAVERSACLGRILMMSECSLAFKSRKNPKCMDTFTHAAADCEIDLIEPQHLDRLDQTGISGRAGRADRIMRTSDLQIDRDFASRIVGNRSRIVVMRPVTSIIIKLGNIVDLVLGFDVSMFGQSDVNPDTILFLVFPIDPGIAKSFVRTVNSDASGTRPDPNLFSGLIPERIKGANTGMNRIHVAHIDGLDTGNPFQQVFPIFLQVVPIGRGQSDASDNYPAIYHERKSSFKT